MLFDRSPLTPEQQTEVLMRHFGRVSGADAGPHEGSCVPLSVLEAYGEFNRHLRYLIAAAIAEHRSKRLPVRPLRRLERELDALPRAIMLTLSAGHEQDWMSAYRLLLRLHSLTIRNALRLDAEEYETIIGKMVQLAARIADAAAVRINAASMFSLLLIQTLLHERQQRRHKAVSRGRRRSKLKGSPRRSDTHPRPDAALGEGLSD
ncbi:MAG TPA: hypothetical protein H9976_03350 [Candidatus Akkermansia intestinavium]|nr:hypothetical protein [Candidatus Akkermansia intestinavium]